jgi:hypothetical protein
MFETLSALYQTKSIQRKIASLLFQDSLNQFNKRYLHYPIQIHLNNSIKREFHSHIQML